MAKPNPDIRKLNAATEALCAPGAFDGLTRAEMRDQERAMAKAAERLLEACRAINPVICRMPSEHPRLEVA